VKILKKITFWRTIYNIYTYICNAISERTILMSNNMFKPTISIDVAQRMNKKDDVELIPRTTVYINKATRNNLIYKHTTAGEEMMIE